MLRYYFIIIGICTVLIAVISAVFAPFGTSVLMTALCVLLAFSIDAAVALFTRYVLPKSFFNPFRRRFTCARFEKSFYSAIGIRKWKDKIPETGGLLVKFPKNRVLDFHDNEYLFKFMEETCYAEIMHVWSIFLGFAVLFACKGTLRLTIALPVAAVNALLQLLPVFVQRFIRPQLARVYQRNAERSRREPDVS